MPSPTSLYEGELQVTRVLFTMQWRLMSQILLALPVVGMFICLITSIIFHSDHINNTICKVYNFLPSISAVTGVSPQRYLWRVAVALHISPRLLVAWVGRAYYTALAPQVPAVRRPAYLTLVTAAFYLNLIELITLCGVTYISNKENYPVHEKLFTLFMLVSLVYMLCMIRVVRAVKHTLSPRLLRSFNQKKWIFGIKLASTGGLLFFFWRHRVFCQPMAFSWFSLCEYVIATCNMLYHVSVALDFSDEHLIVGHIQVNSPEGAAPPLQPLSSSGSLYTSSSSPSSTSQHFSFSPTAPSVPLSSSIPPYHEGNTVRADMNGHSLQGRLNEPVQMDPLSEHSKNYNPVMSVGGTVKSGAPERMMEIDKLGAGCDENNDGKQEEGKIICEAENRKILSTKEPGLGEDRVRRRGGGGNVGEGNENLVVESRGESPGMPPSVVHQVLNTIHENNEPLQSPPCLNGPDESEQGSVHRRLNSQSINNHQLEMNRKKEESVSWHHDHIQ